MNVPQGFMQDFSVGVGEMEPRPLGGVGCAPPVKCTCSEVASGG